MYQIEQINVKRIIIIRSSNEYEQNFYLPSRSTLASTL